MSFNKPPKPGLGAALLAILDDLDREAARKPDELASTPVPGSLAKHLQGLTTMRRILMPDRRIATLSTANASLLRVLDQLQRLENNEAG
jgi:hypothetical protein